MKYKLTFWQKIELIPLKLMWLLTNKANRRSWHLIKKGMEKHNHKFTKVIKQDGYRFLKCEHEGCNVCKPID